MTEAAACLLLTLKVRGYVSELCRVGDVVGGALTSIWLEGEPCQVGEKGEEVVKGSQLGLTLTQAE